MPKPINSLYLVKLNHLGLKFLDDICTYPRHVYRPAETSLPLNLGMTNFSELVLLCLRIVPLLLEWDTYLEAFIVFQLNVRVELLLCLLSEGGDAHLSALIIRDAYHHEPKIIGD